MSRALWEINMDIASCWDEETGEIFDSEKLEALEIEWNVKIENIALYIKNLKASAEAIKAEEEALRARRQHKEKKAESLKNYLAYALDGNKFETARTAVTFRKSVSVEVEDIDALPDEYIRTKVEQSPDKTAIRDALKAGITVPGAYVVEKQNCTVK